MYEHRRPEFLRKLRGNVGATANFWRHMQGSQFLDNHPVLTESLFGKTIPLGMHGDGGSFTKQDSVYAFSWNSLTQAFGPTMDTRILFTVMRSADMVEGTLDALMEKMAWSLNLCLRGETEDGQVLAGGWRGATVQVRGDWEFFVKFCHLPRRDGAQNMCPFCRAACSDPLMTFTNVRPDAPWRGTIWTHESRMTYLRLAGIAPPVFFLTLRGFRLECIHIDTLHTLDQGVTSHVVGNVLWHIAVVMGCLGGTTIATKIAALNKYMKAWYNRTKCSRRLQGELTPLSGSGEMGGGRS
jgi:hypothetical protein